MVNIYKHSEEKAKYSKQSFCKTKRKYFAECIDYYILCTFCFKSFVYLSNMGPVEINE